MREINAEVVLNEEDLRAALKELRVYMDVTEEDLMKIYEIAMKHARARLVSGLPISEHDLYPSKCATTTSRVEQASS